MKKAVVDTKRCVACGACANVCNRDAIQMYKGLYALILEDRCVGCGRCSWICPASNITIEEKETER